MWKFGVTAAAAIIASLAAGQAQAAPVCTGTTSTIVGPTGAVSAAFLLTAGNCVAAGDKIFGDFDVSGNFSGAGSTTFTFFNTPGNVTVGFQGSIGSPLVAQQGTLVYEVVVDPTLSQGHLINGLQFDLTLNGVGNVSSTLTGSGDNGSVFSCSREVNPSGGTCADQILFAPISDLTITQVIDTEANAFVTALTNTVLQVAAVPEPASLALLGTALFGFGWFNRRRRRAAA